MERARDASIAAALPVQKATAPPFPRSFAPASVFNAVLLSGRMA